MRIDDDCVVVLYIGKDCQLSYNLIVPAKASRGQLPLVSSQTRERVPHSSMQNTAQCKSWYSYASIPFSHILFKHHGV